MIQITDEFTKVCNISELKDRQGKRFTVNDIEVAVFLVDGKIYALQNHCPHQHAPIIYDGFVEDCKVVCPAHGWEFNLKDGKLNNNRKGLDSYEVIINDENVYVKVIDKKFNW